MDFDEILDWVNDNKIIIIAGAVGVAFFMTMLNKNSDSKTVIQPVTTGSSYPTVSENAETIMSNMSISTHTPLTGRDKLIRFL